MSHQTTPPSSGTSGIAAREVKAKRRAIILMTGIVAAFPVIIQIAVLIYAYSAPASFPNLDKMTGTGAFWAIQITLFAVAMAGSTLVNFFTFVTKSHINSMIIIIEVLFIFLILAILSAVVAASLLNSSAAGWGLFLLALLGILNIILSYQVEMHIAGAEAGLV